MAQSNDAPWENYRQPASGDSAGPWSNYAANPELGLATPKSSTLSDLGKSVKAGVQRLPGMVTGLADLPIALATGARPVSAAADALGEATGFQPGKWADETKFSPAYEAGRQNVDEAWKDGSAGDIALAYLKNPAYTANQVAESLPSMVAGGVLGRAAMGAGAVAAKAANAATGTAARAATPGVLARTVGEKWAAPVAAGIGEGVVTAGQQMEQATGEDQQRNAVAALGAGALTGAIGVGAGRVANRLGLETAETAMAKIGTGATTEVPLSAQRRILGGMVSEAVLQELPQSAQEQMWQNYADGKPLMEGVARASTEGAIAGGVMGAGANVSGGANRRARQADQQGRQRAEDAAASANQLAEEASIQNLAGQPVNPVDLGAPASFEDLVTSRPQAEPDPYTAWDQQVQAGARTAQPGAAAPAKAAGPAVDPFTDWDEQNAAVREFLSRPQDAPQQRPDYLAEVQAAVRSGTQFSTQQTVDTVRDAMEDAWLAQNVGADPAGAPASGAGLQAADAMGVQLQGQFQQASEDAGIAAVDARVRTGRILSGLQNLLDGGAQNTAQVLGGLNEGLARINEQPLDTAETQRVRRMVDAYMGFRGVGEPAPLPADRAPAVDPFADNAAMEALIPQRPLQRPSERMGINPADGPLSRGAAMAVDAGFDATQQATLQAQEIANAQGAQAQAAAVAAPAANPPTGPGALEAAGPGPLTQTTGATFAPQADQAQQAGAQPPQATGAPSAPAAGAAAAQEGLTNASTTTFNDGAQGGPAPGAQGQAQAAAPRPANWRSSALPAGRVARSLGIDPKGKRLAQILAEIDAADAARSNPVSPATRDAQLAKLRDELGEGVGTYAQKLATRLGDARYSLMQAESLSPMQQRLSGRNLAEIRAEIARLESAAESATLLDDIDLRDGLNRSMLAGARQELDASPLGNQDRLAVASAAREAGNAADAAATVFAAVDGAETPALARKQSPDPQFSRDMPEELAREIRKLRPPVYPATNASVRQAVGQLVGSMGMLPNRLGRIVVTTSDDIRANWEPLIGPVAMGAEGGGKAQGFYDPNTKTVFIISDHIVAGDELGVVAHELMHKHGPAVLGEEGWNQLHGAIGGWASAQEGSLERQVYNEAAARVRDSQPAVADAQAYSSQELFPYAVQVALEMGVRPNALAKPGTVARWLDQVRKVLRQVWAKIAGSRSDFGSQDLVNLAFGIAQRENPAHTGELDGAIASTAESSAQPEQADAASMPGQAGERKDEQRARILQGDPILTLTGEEAPQTGMLAVRQWATELFRQQGGKAVNPEIGEVTLDGRSVRDSMAHGKPNPFKYTAFAAVKDVLEKGAVVLSTQHGRDGQSFYVSAPVRIKGVDDVVTVLVRRDPNDQRMYLHSVATKENLLNRRVSGTDTAGGVERSGSSNSGDGSIVAQQQPAGKLSSEAVANEINRLLKKPVQFSRAAPAAPTASDYTAEQARAAEHAFGVQVKQTWAERAQAMRQNFGTRLRQGLVDQFAPLKEISEKAYILARLSKGSDGAVEAALLYGKPYLRDGVADVDIKDGGFANVLASLKGEHDRFFQWVAAQRAQRLKAEGKENLLTDRDITALRSLDAGRMADGTARMPLYAAALRELNAFNEASLKVARDSGLIDQAAYDLMKDQPYVPFYRLMEEDGGMRGPRFSSGLVNQQAWKKLKGGTQQLNADLLQNTLMNWSHLYAAAARNRASLETMDAAEKLGAAERVPADTKGSVKVMRNGVAEHWAIEDPLLVDAISAMSYTPGGIVKAMAPFKRLLTFGVTVNPTFKIRNLIRDSLSAIAQSDLSYNPLENVAKGWKATSKNSQTYASMLASGGIIKFGTQENTNQLRGQIERLGGTMLDKQGFDKLKDQMRSLWEVYEEFGDRTENVNRTALYERLRAKGLSHAEASFQARDLMDFSMSGKWETVRFLAQTVPFLNARLQGLYKLGRAAGEDPRRFAAMAGAVSLASLGLLAAYADDDDWKKREDFDRDNFWWFKIGDKAFRIPKPFEVGAIGTVAERTAELMMSEEMTGKRFGQRISDMVFNTFAMDPTPQAIKPFLDVYANKDSFSGRAIEGMADERLRPQDRYNERTSEVARLLGSWGLPDPVRLAKGEYSGLSPKQVDFLLRGYFGWLATVSTTATDTIARPMLDRGERPAMRWRDAFVAGNFVEELPTGSSRYVTTMYEQAKGVEQAWASHQAAIKSGDVELARSIQEEEGPKLRNRMAINAAKQQMAELGQRAKKIEGDRLMSGEIKRERLTQIEQQRNAIAQRVAGLTD
nr:LPD38 domain-containing protein [Delftia acidovorans]